MANKILIDATFPEETRVAVADGNRRLVALDYDSKSDGQLSGNIYLATVVRVEAALQAAFVDYGGDRHGFLAFPEIHPDYYQIPESDRADALAMSESMATDEMVDESPPPEEAEDLESAADSADRPEDDNGSGADASDARPKRSRARPPRGKQQYLIQEVIRNRQLLLVQVSKEPRGDKGAALTTYISLAGRYCVLMPNAGHRAGGISRKIGGTEDRKRLRAITKELEVPESVSLIVRTAGSGRGTEDIKRDYESLLELWESIRRRTVASRAPCLIHDESNILRRAVRDLYSKDVNEIIVAGEEAYSDVREQMRSLVSPQAKNVRQYRGKKPLFDAFGIEEQLDKLFASTVPLPSGGSIVIAQTEALTAIDVNSGRANRDRQIEHTAVRTNLEAAEEVARQLWLRDLAGLIVIDFIDMEEGRNRRAVESRFREQLRSDRARIQTSDISNFGLLEMSRQRLRKSMVEMSAAPCEACGGTGLVRSGASSALAALRQLSEWLTNRKTPQDAELQVSVAAANCLFNELSPHVAELQERFKIQVRVLATPTLTGSEAKVQALSVAKLSDAKPDSARARSRSGRDGDTRRERTSPASRRRSADVDGEEGEAESGESTASRRRVRRRTRPEAEDDRPPETEHRARPPRRIRRSAQPTTDDAAAADDSLDDRRSTGRGRRGRTRAGRDESLESQPESDAYGMADAEGDAVAPTDGRSSRAAEPSRRRSQRGTQGRRFRQPGGEAEDEPSDSEGAEVTEEFGTDPAGYNRGAAARRRNRTPSRSRASSTSEPGEEQPEGESSTDRGMPRDPDADRTGDVGDDGAEPAPRRRGRSRSTRASVKRSKRAETESEVGDDPQLDEPSTAGTAADSKPGRYRRSRSSRKSTSSGDSEGTSLPASDGGRSGDDVEASDAP